MAIKTVEFEGTEISYPKATPWKENNLKGEWLVSLKIDGIRVFHKDGKWFSRAGKKLHNLEHLDVPEGSYEVYNGNWEDSVSLVRTSVNGSPVARKALYKLSNDPVELDDRLYVCVSLNPTIEEINRWLTIWVGEGYEGIMLSQGDKILKVKPKDTADVRITGCVEGKGKHKGRLGLFTTNYGNCGTGFTDAQREEFWAKRDEMVGSIIEVEFMEWTPAGKMRHPRFLRERWDKDTETVNIK